MRCEIDFAKGSLAYEATQGVVADRAQVFRRELSAKHKIRKQSKRSFAGGPLQQVMVGAGELFCVSSQRKVAQGRWVSWESEMWNDL